MLVKHCLFPTCLASRNLEGCLGSPRSFCATVKCGRGAWAHQRAERNVRVQNLHRSCPLVQAGHYLPLRRKNTCRQSSPTRGNTRLAAAPEQAKQQLASDVVHSEAEPAASTSGQEEVSVTPMHVEEPVVSCTWRDDQKNPSAQNCKLACIRMPVSERMSLEAGPLGNSTKWGAKATVLASCCTGNCRLAPHRIPDSGKTSQRCLRQACLQPKPLLLHNSEARGYCRTSSWGPVLRVQLPVAATQSCPADMLQCWAYLSHSWVRTLALKI